MKFQVNFEKLLATTHAVGVLEMEAENIHDLYALIAQLPNSAREQRMKITHTEVAPAREDQVWIYSGVEGEGADV